MKPPIFIFVACGLALTATASASGLTTPEQKHLQPSAPRIVTISEADTPPVIRAGLLQSTLIELPAEEKVATVFGGDTVSWVFDAGQVASRYISIKPKVADSATDLHIISDHGNEYTIELREISSDKDNPHFDSKVYVTSSDAKAAENMAKAPVFVPAAEAAENEAELRKEVEAARKAAVNLRHFFKSTDLHNTRFSRTRERSGSFNQHPDHRGRRVCRLHMLNKGFIHIVPLRSPSVSASPASSFLPCR